MSLFVENLRRVVGQTDFRSRSHQNDIGSFLAEGRQHVRAKTQIGNLRTSEGWHGLTGQRQHGGTVTVFDRDPPGLRGLVRVRGADDRQIWDGAQRGEVLHGLVRRPVFAEADAIVREHKNGRDVRQRRDADRRPVVIRENQERPAVGNQSAKQGHAVHGRGHRMFAHTEVEVASLRGIFLEVGRAVNFGVVRGR